MNFSRVLTNFFKHKNFLGFRYPQIFSDLPLSFFLFSGVPCLKNIIIYEARGRQSEEDWVTAWGGGVDEVGAHTRKIKFFMCCVQFYFERIRHCLETKRFANFFYSSSSLVPLPVNVSFLFSFNVPHLMWNEKKMQTWQY